jgi:PEP-CTERM motif
MRNAFVGGLVALGAVALAGQALAEVNVIPSHWSLIQIDGTFGVLRAGSPWGSPPATASDPLEPVNGVFQPEFQQWNDQSFWWDQDPSVNTEQVDYIINLDQTFTFNRFVVQADDNDTYRLEFWDGAAWQTAWDIPAVPSFGLRTRDSGLVGEITTNALRFTATGGDNYYGVSEIQAFSVPEPATWTLMISGFGLAGAALRRRQRGLV